MRNSSITGVLEASDSSKPFSTCSTMEGRFGRGSSSHICDLHREGVAALLHDGGALAVILADDDQRPAGDAARGEVGERVRGDVGADRGLERDGAAQRIVRPRPPASRRRWPRRRTIRSGRRAPQDVVGVRQHVHQVRDRRALIAGDVGDAGLQQRLGDGENALAAEFLAAPRRSFSTSSLNERSAISSIPARSQRDRLASPVASHGKAKTSPSINTISST